MARVMHGRKIITSGVAEVTRANVLSVLDNAITTHLKNRNEIKYLWDYYKGKQPILYRKKAVRPEICNRIVENRANEIVSFKTGYLCGEPIQYIGRGGGDGITEQISKLNELMFSENKATQDKEIVEWQHICGTAFRMVLPDEPRDVDDAPFEIYTLDPRGAFVVYSEQSGNKPLMGVKYVEDESTIATYSIYTPTEYFEVRSGAVIASKSHALADIPIIEYPANNARLGSFEIVLPLLDAINTTASNRLDAVEQTVQAFIKFINCDIDLDTFQQFRAEGAIKVKSTDGQKADVDLVTGELGQDQAQTLVDDLYQTVLTICGMPNRNGGSSTSDTGAAVIMRDGWSLAEARAKDSELMFKSSEQRFLKLVLRICRDMSDLTIRLREIDVKFTRRNYEAIQSKSQVLVSMLQQNKIHPLLAFSHSGMFSDPESAYSMSMEYAAEQEAKQLAREQAAQENVTETIEVENGA